jgi:hypothetical protein
MTPLWVPLVIAGIGLLGTVVGTIAGLDRPAAFRST